MHHNDIFYSYSKIYYRLAFEIGLNVDFYIVKHKTQKYLRKISTNSYSKIFRHLDSYIDEYISKFFKYK